MNFCNFNDAKKRPLSLDPREVIELIGGNNISVQKATDEDKTTYTIDYVEFASPIIQVNSAIHKVGTTVSSFVFNGQILPGSEDIVSRQMTPDKGLDLSVPFSWTETDITGTSAGLWPTFGGLPLNITVVDSSGVSVSKNVGLDFRHLFYMGFSTLETLTPEAAKAFSAQDLLLNIKSLYGSFTYNYTVIPTYLYWVFPTGTPTFNEASEGPLPVPLKLDHANISIEDEGITKTYRVIRTAVKTRFNNATITLQ